MLMSTDQAYREEGGEVVGSGETYTHVAVSESSDEHFAGFDGSIFPLFDVTMLVGRRVEERREGREGGSGRGRGVGERREGGGDDRGVV